MTRAAHVTRIARPGELKMTSRQRDLARHALGLPNDRCMSYRNRYVANKGHVAYGDWMDLVAAGFAVRKAAPRKRGDHSSPWFYLTNEGAAEALEIGEVLDPEDFPL